MLAIKQMTTRQLKRQLQAVLGGIAGILPGQQTANNGAFTNRMRGAKSKE